MLPEDADLTEIELRVRDLDTCLAYYQDVLGFEIVDGSGGTTTLRLGAGRITLKLTHVPDAPMRPFPSPGLFHFALVVPDRPALGAIFRHLVERREPFDGMSDHAVSEALYLRDPEHNGIELYRDRPRDEWPYDSSGGVAMVSDPLDTPGLASSADGPSTLHPDTRFGHIHLHVRDLAAGEAFYKELGLHVTQRSLPGAVFLALRDYHHHVAVNTWAPDVDVPDGATGIVGYTWRAPGASNQTLVDPAGAEVRIEAA